MTDATPGTGSTAPGLHLSPGDTVLWTAAAARARTEHWAQRLFERDPSLWSSDTAVQA